MKLLFCLYSYYKLLHVTNVIIIYNSLFVFQMDVLNGVGGEGEAKPVLFCCMKSGNYTCLRLQLEHFTNSAKRSCIYMVYSYTFCVSLSYTYNTHKTELLAVHLTLSLLLRHGALIKLSFLTCYLTGKYCLLC